MSRRVLAATVIVIVLGIASAPTARAAEPPPIDHVIVIVLENATFDNVFGTYPGAHGLDPQRDQFFTSRGRIAEPRPLDPADLGTEGPFQARRDKEVLSNGRKAAIRALHGGDMDGFLRAQVTRGGRETLVMRHFDRSTMGALFRLADENVLFDRYFSSALGDSLPNTLHLIAGESHGITIGTKSVLQDLWRSSFPTIFDRAEEAGLSWRYYVGGLDSIDKGRLLAGRYFTRRSPSTPSPLYWAPVLSIKRFWTDPQLREEIRPQEDFFHDAATGRLPAISYVLPSPSTHWPTRPEISQARLLSIVNGIKKSPQWERTATFVVWDDWGGFYDHVKPPRKDDLGLGFRLPALLVSPLAKNGYISSRTYDHSSIPNFIADVFGMRGVGRVHTDDSFRDAWSSAPTEKNAIVTLGDSSPYRAHGSEHARSVLVLYLAGVAITAAVMIRLWRGRIALKT